MKPIIVPCARCAVPCRVAETRTEEANILRHAKGPDPDGLCINCAVTEWLMLWQGIPLLLDDYGPELLLSPEWQQAVPRIFAAAQTDARPEWIDWQIVVKNWRLPFPGAPKTAGTTHAGYTKR